MVSFLGGDVFVTLYHLFVTANHSLSLHLYVQLFYHRRQYLFEEYCVRLCINEYQVRNHYSLNQQRWAKHCH